MLVEFMAQADWHATPDTGDLACGYFDDEQRALIGGGRHTGHVFVKQKLA
jgi:hypothetical protein